MRKIDYLSTTALTPVNYEPYTEHGGGGFKKVVSVVAAVVIPFAATAISSAIGLSAAITSTAGSAIVGAGLGAIKGAITGEDIGRSALMGGITGGVAGYMNPGIGPSGVPNQAFSGTMVRPDAYRAATANYVPAGGSIGGASTTSTSPTTTQVVDSSGNVVNIDNPNLANQVVGAENLQAGQTFVDGAGAGLDPLQGPTLGGPTLDTVAQNSVNNYGTYLKDVAGDTTGVFARTGEEILSRFKDPDRLADVAIQSSINLLGSTLVGAPEMSPEEKEILELQKEQLEKLKERDEEAYDFAMAQARRYLGLAEDYDPSIRARQSYQQAMNRAGVAQRNALRQINPSNTALMAAERRRFQLGSAANAATAYDKGMLSGLNTQAGLYDRAANVFPKGDGQGYNAALTGLKQSYANLAKKRSDAQAGLNQMFGAFTVPGGDGNDTRDYASFRSGYRSAFGDMRGMLGARS